jgi:pyruvate/2-oxoglutarate dehydrogenase complex dihydrolipoamide dehydrogenase (E3) component
MADAYDLIAIGSGQAGESATELASFFGHRSEVIERARPGGTVTSGGAPTKTLREAAIYFSGLSEGDVYGVRISTPRCGGTMNTIANMLMNTPTYSYAYKYAAFDGLRRLVSSEREERVG